jgi:hypothetical protein
MLRCKLVTFIHITMKLTAIQQSVKEALDKLDVNTDKVVERLQYSGFVDSRFTEDEIKLAFYNWFNYHIEAIESDAEWWIKSEQVFYKSLPYDRLEEEPTEEMKQDFGNWSENQRDETYYDEMTASDFNPDNQIIKLQPQEA